MQDSEGMNHHFVANHAVALLEAKTKSPALEKDITKFHSFQNVKKLESVKPSGSDVDTVDNYGQLPWS